MKNIPKSIGAVLAGFVLVLVLAVVTDAVFMAMHVFPAPDHPELYSDRLYLLITFYTAIYSVAGGWLTARLAPAWPRFHALILGLLGTLSSTVGAILMWGKATGHEWYPVALIAIASPTCWLGGWIYTKGKRA